MSPFKIVISRSTSAALIALRLMLLLLPVYGLCQPYQLVINEIMASNQTTIADEDGDFADWIEIYNIGSQKVNLAGYGLSDDPERPFRWVFPDVEINPEEFLLIWASGKNRIDPSAPLHTGFSISSEGEDILLTSPGEVLIDKMPAAVIPADISYGRRSPGNNELVYFLQPTPGFANHSETFAGIMSPPSLSMPAGFYASSQSVAITHDDAEAEIRYTLNGALPDVTSPVYQEPLLLDDLAGTPNGISMIRTNPAEVPASLEWYPPMGEVDKAHTLRAVAFRPGYIPSAATTATYFTGHQSPALPVFSIVTHHDNLFDYTSGIYIPGLIFDQNGYGDGWYGQLNANYFQRGFEWEVPASVEYFENGLPRLQQDVGIRIHGGGTRALPMKSLRIYARGGYGRSYLTHDFFPGQGIQDFNRLLLRNSGQDFYGHGVLLRDGFMQKLVEPLGIPVQDYSPAIVFLNGEYWGIQNIRERYDEHYFERKYDIPAENLDFLESNQRVLNGSAGHFSDMIAFIEEHPLSDPEAYSRLQGMMDTDNFMDYYIVNIYYNNIDWPGHNLKFFRYNGVPEANPPFGKDGRWRWAFNDFDFGFGNTSGLYPHNQNTLVYATHPEGSSWPPNPPWSTFLIRSLLENTEFRNAFINRFADLMNSIFSPPYVTGFLNEMKLAIEPEVMRHMRRWSHPGTGMDEWQANMDRMIRFADRRPDHQTGHIIGYFDLEGTFRLQADVNDPGAGTVMINRLLLEDTPAVIGDRAGVFPWEGKYFKNVPLNLKAIPFPGYEFIRWTSGDGTEYFENPLILEASDDMELMAEFGEREVLPPVAFSVTQDSPFLFTQWDRPEEAGSYPDHMSFVFMDSFDPGPEAQIEGYTMGRYDNESRTRINGHNCGGISFINTSNVDGNPGYPGGRLGGALLALDTRDAGNLHLMFHAATVNRNSRIYNLRLQYRLDDHGEFFDLIDEGNEPVEYHCSFSGHSWNSRAVRLPEHLHGQAYVQLFWRYYYTGVREDANSGQRSELRVGSIAVFEGDAFPEPELLANAGIIVPEGIICENETAGFNAVFNGESPHSTYRWFVDNQSLAGSDGNFQEVENLRPGVVLQVEVDDLSSCLHGLPALSAMVSPEILPAPERAVIEQRDNSLFSSSESGNQWYEETTGVIAGADQQEFIPEDTGNYYVIVTDGVCYSGPSDTISFTPVSLDSVPGQTDSGITIYPNPSGPVIRVKPGERHTEVDQWRIYNSIGRLMSIGKAGIKDGNGEFTIDISTLEPGIYILMLLTPDDIIQGPREANTVKFIRE